MSSDDLEAVQAGPVLPVTSPLPTGVPTGGRRLLTELADRWGTSPAGVVGTGLALLALVVGAWWLLRPAPSPPVEAVLPRVDSVAPTIAPSTSSRPSTLVVHVDGAVTRPGVHELPVGSRVADAVRAAGGLAADADRTRINLAALVVDGSRVWIPTRGEETVPPVLTGATSSAGAAGSAGPVDVNTADRATLESLPGIGPTIAAAIVETRTARGGFASVDELVEVPGIGPTRLEALRDLVTVG